MAEEENQIILYTTDDGKSQVSLMSRDGRIWLNQKQMAELFAVTKMNISLHIANILREKELDDSVVKSYFTTAADGKRYNVVYYALEMILAVGFRVRGVRGTQFRQWANAHLSEYLVKGFTTFGARRRRGLRTRRTWRSCDESRTKPSAVSRTRRAEMNAEGLEKIVARHERQCLELKESFNVECIKTACAFANARGGRILFGVANDRTVRGIAHDQVFAEMDGIVNSIMNGCSPRVPIDVGIENIDGSL